MHEGSASADQRERRAARRYLDLAARAAWRGWGMVEPNPMVGCVLVKDDQVIAIGHHRTFGGLHAERDALASLAARGEQGRARGATAYVTLEPCNGVGKQPACVAALIEAGVVRVIYAAADVSASKGGGAEALRRAGIAAEQSDASASAARLSEPWRKRQRTSLPWVIGKWAQSIDGRIATASGESKWISGERSRRLVHLTRARVDAVLTGIGTVRRDDPLLTSRLESPNLLRRRALRIIVDPRLELPTTAVVMASLRDGLADGAGVLVATSAGSVGRYSDRALMLEQLGAKVLGVEESSMDGRFDLRSLLASLLRDHGVATILVEAGPRLMGSFFSHDLVDEAHVYTAPFMIGEHGLPCVGGGSAPATINLAKRATLVGVVRRGDDTLNVYRWT